MGSSATPPPTTPSEDEAGEGYDVFLCHAGTDKPAVRTLGARLRAEGLTVWIDEEAIDPGDSILAEIDRGLRESRFVLVCLSAAFARSNWAREEWQAALHAQIQLGAGKVVPVRVAEGPESEVPRFLASRRIEDVRTTEGVARIVTMLRAAAGHAPPSQRAPRRSRGPTVERRLTLKGVTAGIEAQWIHPGAVADAFTMPEPLTVEDRVEHRYYLEESLRWRGPGDLVRTRAFEQRLETIGRALYKSLRGDADIHPLADLARVEPAGASESAQPHRLFTIASTDADALSLPWELVRDDKSPLLLRDVILRRQLLTTQDPALVQVTLPLRILWIVSRPTDVGFLDPRSSLKPALDALATLGGLVEIDLCTPPTLAEVTRRLDAATSANRPFHLVHFDGHGVYLQNLSVGALCFEKADATNDLVEGPRFGDLLSRHHVPVALLEACQTADLSTSVFGSVAPALLKAGVGSVIAFSHAVTLSGARVLVRCFYEALCQGATIGEALRAAREGMRADPVRHTTRAGEALTLIDWHIPQLYQAGTDPVIVPGGAPLKKSPTRAEREKDKLRGEGFQLEPMYGFRGRARELLDLERKLRAHTAVVVKGMGGMGKTTLAVEAGRWWTRTGQRPAGAVFTSFEQRPTVEQVVRSIGVAFDGEDFVRLSEEQQRERAIELFRTKEVLWIWDNFESMLPQYQRETGISEAEAASAAGETGSAEGDKASPAGGKPRATGEKGAVPGMFEVVTDEERRKVAALFRALTGKGAGVPKGWLLVTCRPDETGLVPIANLDLLGLLPVDGLEMAKEILSLHGISCERPGYEREAIEALLVALDNHPLSSELVVPHLAKSKPAEVQRDFGKLLDRFTNPNAVENRNRSLRASLAFSADRLGAEVKEVLPYLAWFEGGGFEDVVLDFTQWTPEKWGRARERLESVALVRAEAEGVQFADRPFLVFHPTLPYAARAEDVPDREAAEKRWVEVYAGLAGSAYRALVGKNPAGGMAVVAREERNLRRAAARAFGSGQFEEGGMLAEVIGLYLDRMGRPREQARWGAWAQAQMAAAPAGPARWARELEHAWGLALEGKVQEAAGLLRAQLVALEAAGADVGQRALCNGHLGRIWVNARQPGQALAPLEAAIRGFEACGDEGNLSVALGDQAVALRQLGRLAEALEVAERGVALDRKLGRTRNEAAGLGRTAEILKDMHRFGEAEVRYGEALAAARTAGDPGLEGTVFQHLGILADAQQRFATAIDHYKAALERFQATGDRAGEMQTADLLGTAEMNLDHFAAAAAWYDQAEALATALGNEHQLGITAQNRGVLLQQQALAHPEGPERTHLIQQAVQSLQRSLAIRGRRKDAVGTAASLSQLGVLYRYLRDLAAAESHAREALAIREALDLPEVYKDYWSLENIATARGDEAQAAHFRRKKEAKIAELEQLAGPPRLNPKFLQAVTALCQAIGFARSTGAPLPLPVTEALTALSSAPEPIAAAGRFLTALAAPAGGQSPDAAAPAGGQNPDAAGAAPAGGHSPDAAHAETPLPPLPDNLPAELRSLLEQLATSLSGSS